MIGKGGGKGYSGRLVPRSLFRASVFAVGSVLGWGAGDAPAQVFMQPSVDTNPDAFGSAFSDVGFGPGPYVGGYTGVEAGGGLTGIYWGSYDATVAPGSQGTNVFNPVHFAPGAAVINAVCSACQVAGDTLVRP